MNAGSEVGHSDKDGMTALHCTASLGFSKCVQVKSPAESSVRKKKDWFGRKQVKPRFTTTSRIITSMEDTMAKKQKSET